MSDLVSTLIAGPVANFITVDEAKRQIRRDDDDDNELIEQLIAVVMSRLDGMNGVLGRGLINQSWMDVFDCFPSGDILRLGLTPVASITSIEYYDSSNVFQTFESSKYSFHNRPLYGYAMLSTDSAWPSVYDRDDAVQVTYVAGYGGAAVDVPAAIKHAGLLLLANLYENRESVIIGQTATELPNGVNMLLRPFIRPRF